MGIVLAYLPPYSPDLNPIEEAFAQLKQWIQKNRAMAISFDGFDGFLRTAMKQLKDKMKRHFVRCRIGRTQPRDDDDMAGDTEDHLMG